MRKSANVTFFSSSLRYDEDLVEREDFDDGFDLTQRRGRSKVRRRAPGVVLVSYEGMATEEVVPEIAAFLEDEIARAGKIRFFVDAGDLITYTTEYRKAWTVWLKAHRSDLGEVQMLVRSRIVRMGINVVNPLVGNFLIAYSERGEFESALDDAVVSASTRRTG